MSAARLALARFSRSLYSASGSSAGTWTTVRASNPGMTTAMLPTATYNETMQDLVKRMLEELGEDPDREGLVKTPKRVDKALRFLTSGYSADIDTVLNEALFSVDYNEM